MYDKTVAFSFSRCLKPRCVLVSLFSISHSVVFRNCSMLNLGENVPPQPFKQLCVMLNFMPVLLKYRRIIFSTGFPQTRKRQMRCGFHVESIFVQQDFGSGSYLSGFVGFVNRVVFSLSMNTFPTKRENIQIGLLVEISLLRDS